MANADAMCSCPAHMTRAQGQGGINKCRIGGLQPIMRVCVSTRPVDRSPSQVYNLLSNARGTPAVYESATALMHR